MTDWSQPNSNDYALQGYTFLRLKQYLSTAGDIFETEQSAHAFALGPDSDISEVTVAYFDQQVEGTFMQELTLTPQRTFESFVPAFNKTKTYAPSKNPGRILIWPTEIFDSSYLPFGFTPDVDRFVFEQPLIDILEFFQPPPALSSVRADKTYYYDILPITADMNCFVAIPFYGRRFASVVVQNSANATNATMAFRGVNFRISEGDAAEVNLLTAAFETITFATTDAFSYNAQSGRPASPLIPSSGLFDYLLFQFRSADPISDADPANLSLRVVVSDSVDG